MNSKSATYLAVVTLCLGPAGCGGGPAAPDLAPVSGTVTLNNAPLPDATVTFMPEKGPVAIGVTNMNGEYSLRTGVNDGAVLGKHRVTVALAARSDKPANNEPPSDPSQMGNYYEKVTAQRAKQEGNDSKSLIPEKYGKADSSGLSFEVKDGENNFPINLE